jgi:hypothetical protein
MEEPKKADVVRLPPTRERLTEFVREIGLDSTRWSIAVPYKSGQDWRKLVNRRQIELCLRDGYILDARATQDAHGNWAFRIARVCAGLDVVIDVVLESREQLPRLFVISIQGDQINT